MPGAVCFWIFDRFAIFNNFTAESVRITMLLNKFFGPKFSVDFFNPLICCFNRIFNIENVLLEIFIIQQVIFGKIVEGAGCLF